MTQIPTIKDTTENQGGNPGSTPGTPPTTTDTSSATSATDGSAKASITNFLGQYGLASLGSWAWNEYLHGTPIDQIMLDLRSTPEYQQRFPAMATLSSQGRAITEAQYLSFEQSVRDVNHQYGIPQGFLDKPEDIAKLLTGNVSASEYSSRMNLYAQDAYASPPQVQAEMSRLYGVQGPGNLIAYFADPKSAFPELQRQFTAAQVAGQSDITGFGQLTKDQAQGLADQGVTSAQAASGFNHLANLGDILNQRAGENALSQNDLLAAQFGGNAADQQAIEARQSRRLADFQGSQKFDANSSGVGGIGTAQGV